MSGPGRYCCIALAASILFFGCGRGPRTYPVTGKVVFDDGRPLTSGGVVLSECLEPAGAGTNARGAIDEDGQFQLTTFKDNDGALPGKHRFMVKADRDADDYLKRGIIPRPVIDERFESYDTSGLEFTVEQGENELTLVVDLPGRSKARRP